MKAVFYNLNKTHGKIVRLGNIAMKELPHDPNDQARRAAGESGKAMIQVWMHKQSGELGVADWDDPWLFNDEAVQEAVSWTYHENLGVKLMDIHYKTPKEWARHMRETGWVKLGEL